MISLVMRGESIDVNNKFYLSLYIIKYLLLRLWLAQATSRGKETEVIIFQNDYLQSSFANHI